MAPHTSFRKGQPVFVQLKSGEQFFDNFVEKKAKFVHLKIHGSIPVKDIRAMSVARKNDETQR